MHEPETEVRAALRQDVNGIHVNVASYIWLERERLGEHADEADPITFDL